MVDLNMAYYFAIVPARSPELAQAELNAFLRGRRVLTVDRRWVELWGKLVLGHLRGLPGAGRGGSRPTAEERGAREDRLP